MNRKERSEISLKSKDLFMEKTVSEELPEPRKAGKI